MYTGDSSSGQFPESGCHYEVHRKQV